MNHQLESMEIAARKPGYWTMSRVATGALLMLVLLPMGVYGGVRLRYFLQGTEFASVVGWDRERDAPPSDKSGLDAFNTDNLTVPVDSIGSGGPRKDGIPSLTNPVVARVSEVDFLKDDDRVIVVTVAGETRGYPIMILNHHEAVNDSLGGVPIGVFYCPLCDSVSVVDRRMGERVLEFGISGLLMNSNVLLYDRTDDALWSQVGLTAISGPHAGKSLKHLAGWSLMTFDSFGEQFPKARVMTTDTGHERTYQRNPYWRYFSNDKLYFSVVGSDGPYVNKTAVIGVLMGEKARAFVVADIARAEGGVVREQFAEGALELRADGEGMVRVVSLPEGARAVHTFWFAWWAFHPATEVVGELPRKVEGASRPATTRPASTQPEGSRGD